MGIYLAAFNGSFVKMLGALLQALLDHDWLGAWVVIAPIVIVGLLLAAVICFFPQDSDVRLPRPPTFKKRRRP